MRARRAGRAEVVLRLPGGLGSADYQAAARHTRLVAWLVIGIVAAVAWLMVLKPVL